MKKVLIMGGGFAGLSAAAFLSNLNFKVEVLEASPKLGGRAYSFKDKESGLIIDNGQHILMGCYTETLNFLNLINAENNLFCQKRLNISFLKKGSSHYSLKAFYFFYPLNLLAGLLNYKAISFPERLNLLKFFIKLFFRTGKELNNLSVFEWLSREKQNENIRKAFWDFIAVGALNTNTKKASAKIFSDILRRIFFSGNKAAAILLPQNGLSETYCLNSVEFIEAKGGRINLSEQVLEIKTENELARQVVTSERTIDDFDFIISALPLHSLEKILPEGIISPKPDLKYSSILSVHLRLKKNNLKEKFYGLIDSPVHWIFNHGSHITLVISDADYLMEKPGEELLEMVSCELKKYTDLNRENIISYKIIKEKRATFIPSNDILNKRPSPKTRIKNLFLAGDWIDTGLPSTIESAVLSSRLAVNALMNPEIDQQ